MRHREVGDQDVDPAAEQRGPDRGVLAFTAGHADLIAFGRPYIANPDLVERLRTGAPLAEIDWPTVYGAGPQGYSDYPALQPATV